MGVGLCVSGGSVCVCGGHWGWACVYLVELELCVSGGLCMSVGAGLCVSGGLGLCVSGGVGSVCVCRSGPEYVYGGWASICLWGVGLCMSVGALGVGLCVSERVGCVCLRGSGLWVGPVCVCLSVGVGLCVSEGVFVCLRGLGVCVSEGVGSVCVPEPLKVK